MGETVKPERRFQFSMRKVLLWMLAVALTFSILSPLGFDGVGWLFVFGWFVTVLVLRWGCGSIAAATVSVMAGMLLFGYVTCLVASASRPPPFSPVAGAVAGGFLGALIGFMPFLLVEGTCRTIDWVDRIGQSDG